MITVIIDEEIIELFGPTFLRHSVQITPSVEAFKFSNRSPWFWDAEDRKPVFRGGPEGFYQFDDEFTEWLEEHRPELFL